MIHDKGFLSITEAQRAEIMKNADESFCVRSSKGFNELKPKIDGWEYAGDAVLLRLRNVEPHDDPWVSDGPDPRYRRALFWLMGESKRLKTGQARFNQLRCDGIWFGCGKDQIKLKPGEWVLFDDSKKHWVMSDYIWRGASWQMRKSK